MPYIEKADRELYDKHLNNLIDEIQENRCYSIGHVNYCITKFIVLCLDKLYVSIRYENLDAFLGVLDAVGKEFFRRVMAGYEDKKCEQNGDVFLPIINKYKGRKK